MLLMPKGAWLQHAPVEAEPTGPVHELASEASVVAVLGVASAVIVVRLAVLVGESHVALRV